MRVAVESPQHASAVGGQNMNGSRDFYQYQREFDEREQERSREKEERERQRESEARYRDWQRSQEHNG